MNSWQLAKQIRYLLRNRRWENDGANEFVFKSNSVRITPVDIDTALGVGTPSSPFCKINLGRRRSDQQSKGYVAQEIVITLAAQIEGDEMKENSTVGANRSQGKASSKGRGLSEVESELMAVLEDVSSMQGMQIQGFSAESVEVAQVSATVSWVYCEYTFLFYCTSQLAWLSPTSLTASAATGGTITLGWVPVPVGWAGISGAGGQIIRYAAGSTAPATVTDGTAGPSVTGEDDSAIISGLAPGTYSISIFTVYRESGASVSDDRYSSPTSITVTVP